MSSFGLLFLFGGLGLAMEKRRAQRPALGAVGNAMVKLSAWLFLPATVVALELYFATNTIGVVLWKALC